MELLAESLKGLAAFFACTCVERGQMKLLAMTTVCLTCGLGATHPKIPRRPQGDIVTHPVVFCL